MAKTVDPHLPSFDDHPEAWLTTKEAAAVLQVADAAMRRMVHDGKFPHTNVKGSIRVLREAVEAEARQSDPLERRPGEDGVALVERLSGTQLRKLPLLLTPEDVEDLLSIPRTTVYTMLRAGDLPYRMVGKQKRVPLPALILWLTDAA
jgi:excisionase family DNA binding protein